MATNNLLRVENISKEFPGVKALSDVNFDLKKGEVHALCGENGAGKSTLMNILAGTCKQDSGTIYLNGSQVNIHNQKHAQQLGVGIVYQERSLVNKMSVAENIFADRQPKNMLGLIDKRRMQNESSNLLKRLEMDIEPKTQVGKLAPARQQMVEIAKALSLNSKILILDEPTATITEAETVVLFDLIRRLKQSGVSIIYISHRLSEIFEIADRVSVLKDGIYMGTKNIDQTSVDDVVRMMVGRELEAFQYKTSVCEDEVLCIRNFCSGKFRGVDFCLRRGEILGLFGIAGAGRTELAKAIIGADIKSTGELYLFGKKTNISTVKDAIRCGIGYMPEDRKEEGLFLKMSIADNVISGNLPAVCKSGFMQKTKTRAQARLYTEKLNIITPGINQKVVNLSGGNQQKVVLAKWLLVNPKILIVDEPTRGVDVGAKAEIYSIMKELASSGTSIIFISSDLKETLTVCDRLLVMRNGVITGDLRRDEFSEENVMHYAAGNKNQFTEEEVV